MIDQPDTFSAMMREVDDYLCALLLSAGRAAVLTVTTALAAAEAPSRVGPMIAGHSPASVSERSHFG